MRTARREIIVTSELKHLPMSIGDNVVPEFPIAVNGVSSLKPEIGDTELRICKLTQGDNEEYPCLMILQRYTIILSPWDSENERLTQQFYWWRIVKDIAL